MPSKEIAIFHVDAFTDKPFKGNPSAVCITTKPRNAQWMQDVAQEMNLSETAFLYKKKDGFNLRWFTPTIEVDLCGHATLASAHILWTEGYLARKKEARFFTRSGLLKACLKGKLIHLEFPSEPEAQAPENPVLAKALGITPKYIGKNRFDYLIEVDSEEIVRNIKPDFVLLETIPCRGIIVTSRSSSKGYDFVSRFFAPRAGIKEDPVTGSAHCCLGPFWGKKLNKREFKAFQASARGGIVHVRVDKDRVFLSGRAITVCRGTLLIGEKGNK